MPRKLPSRHLRRLSGQGLLRLPRPRLDLHLHRGPNVRGAIRSLDQHLRHRIQGLLPYAGGRFLSRLQLRLLEHRGYDRERECVDFCAAHSSESISLTS